MHENKGIVRRGDLIGQLNLLISHPLTQFVQADIHVAVGTGA